MKYPVEYKEINNVEDLLERIKEEEENYNREKSEIEARGEHANPNLYMQYHEFSCNVIARMTRKLPERSANKLKRYLGGGHEEKQKNVKGKLVTFDADSILTAIEKGKASELLVAIKKIKTLDINQTIRENVSFVLEREEKAFDPETDKKRREEIVEEGSKRKHRSLKFNKDKGMRSAEEVENGEYVQSEKTQKAVIEKTNKNMTKTFADSGASGKAFRLYDYETVNGKRRGQLGKVKDMAPDYYKEIPDVHFANTGFDAVRESLETFTIRVDNVKGDKHLYEACGLNVMKELYAIRNSRGFFQKFFHPFRNSNEKEAIENFRSDLIRNGVNPEKIAATKDSDVDYINEYRENYLEADDLEEYKKSLIIEEEEVEDVKEKVNVVEEDVKEVEKDEKELNK